MPSHRHEAWIEMFRHRPSLAAELLADPLGVDLPAYQQARLDSSELTDVSPTEYRADAVVVLTVADSPVLAVVVEVQLGRDSMKRWSWPVYLTTLRARLQCPTVLLVVCADTPTATWCACPIELGQPGWLLRPLVLGPDRVPVVTDAELASRSPELAVISAMAHGAHPERDRILQVLLGALRSVDHEHANLYTDVVLAALPEAARHQLEALMSIGTYEYQSDFARRYYGQGRTEGEATAVLAVLAARGIDVPEEARSRITGCADLDQLERWLRAAATADSLQDLFA